MQLGIVAALSAEAKCLAGWPDQYQHVSDTSNPLLSEQVKKPLLSVSGMGPEAAQAAAVRLVEYGAEALLSWGCAGALSKKIYPGELLLPHTILTEDGQALHTHKIWQKSLVDHLPGTLKWHEGMLVESSNMVSGPKKKQELACHFNAIAVDMESAAIGRVAKQAGIPFMVIRAVADTADEELPPCIAETMDNKGHLQIRRLLPAFVRQPRLWPQLIRLGCHFHTAIRTLKFVSARSGPLFHV